MDIGKMLLLIMGAIVTLIGTVMMYDARMITKHFFSFGDQNEASMGLKIIGFGLLLIGGGILYVNIIL